MEIKFTNPKKLHAFLLDIFTWPVGQVSLQFHLPELRFYLSLAIGQPLMSIPGGGWVWHNSPPPPIPFPACLFFLKNEINILFRSLEIFASFKYFLLQCFQNKDINKVTILKELVRSLFYVDLHIAVFSICFHYYLK